MFNIKVVHITAIVKISAIVFSLSACAQAETASTPVDMGIRNESSTCVATEAELFDFFSKNGMAYANNAVIQVSQDPTTEVISQDPFTYRIGNLQLCQDIGK